MNLYGEESQHDKIASKNAMSREIIKEILDLKITQQQIVMIMYLLSLELEDIEKMQELNCAIKTLYPDAFIVPLQTQEGVSNGKIIV